MDIAIVIKSLLNATYVHESKCVAIIPLAASSLQGQDVNHFDGGVW